MSWSYKVLGKSDVDHVRLMEGCDLDFQMPSVKGIGKWEVRLYLLLAATFVCIESIGERSLLPFCYDGNAKCFCYNDGFINCRGTLGSDKLVPKLPNWAIHVDLSNNRIEHIRVGDFRHTTNLTILNLASNTISHFDNDCFLGLHNLVKLDLTRTGYEPTKITYTPNLLAPLKKLKILNISFHAELLADLYMPTSIQVLNISRTKPSLYFPNSTFITELDMTRTHFPINTLAFPNLTKLYSTMKYKYVPTLGFCILELQILKAQGRSFPASLFKECKHLTGLINDDFSLKDPTIPIHISRNNFFLDLSYHNSIIESNHITLTKDTFQNLSGCENVSIDFENRRLLVPSSEGLFHNVKSFSLLSFKGVYLGEQTANVIKGLRGSKIRSLNLENVGIQTKSKYIPLSYFRPLFGSSLQELNLLGNDLGNVRSACFKGMEKTLAVLRLGTITHFVQHGLHNLEVLEMVFTDKLYISQINLDKTLEKLTILKITLPKVLIFYLFPEVVPVLKRLEVLRYKVVSSEDARGNETEHIPNVSKTVCAYSQHSNESTSVGSHRHHSSDVGDDIVSGYYRIPTVVSLTEKLRYLEVRLPNWKDSAAVLEVLPTSHLQHLRTLLFSSSYIHEVHEMTFSRMPVLEHLDLSNNGIQRIPEKLFISNKNIKYLDLSFNRLTHLNIHTLQRLVLLEKLSLIGNPLICDCDNREFQFWMRGNHIRVAKAESTLCDLPYVRKRQRVDEYDVEWLECSSHVTFMILTIVAIVTSLTVALVTTIKYYIVDIRYVFAVRQARIAHAQERAPVHEFDAFVSYNWESQNWVMESLRPHVMGNGEFEFKLCIDDVDFIPGHTIYGEIERCLAKSNQIIFVITRAFLQSDWCRYELDLTILELTRSKVHRAILLFLEHIPLDLMEESMTFQLLARHNVCIHWSANDMVQQEFFWKKLLAELRKGQVQALRG